MKVVSSYAVEVKQANKIFRETIRIYRNAVSFCIKAFEENWDVLKELKAGNHDRSNYANKLIHSTKSNTARYTEFDVRFHKLPTFLRLNVVETALGHLSSYHSNLDNL